ncbi:MAG: RDD family protein [Erysipelotrichaceae bacterium]
MKKSIRFEKKYGFLIKRFIAFAADWYFSSILINLLTNILGSIFGSDLIQMYWNLGISSILISLIYFVLIPLLVFKGQTLFMRVLQVKIISDSGDNISFISLFVRYFFGCCVLEGSIYIPSVNIRSILILTVFKGYGDIVNVVTIFIHVITVLSVLCIFIDRKQYRMLHDRVSGTYVIDNANVS